MRFVEAGYRVVGIDVDPKKVVALNARQSYIKHLGQARIAEWLRRRR